MKKHIKTINTNSLKIQTYTSKPISTHIFSDLIYQYRLLTTKEVTKLIGFEEDWIYKHMAKGEFPTPVKYTKGSKQKNLWSFQTIQKWIYDKAKFFRPNIQIINERLIKKKEVEKLTSCKIDTINKKIAKNEFPKPIKIGRSSRWLYTETLQWLKERS